MPSKKSTVSKTPPERKCSKCKSNNAVVGYVLCERCINQIHFSAEGIYTVNQNKNGHIKNNK